MAAEEGGDARPRARRLEWFKHGAGAITALGGVVGAIATIVAAVSGAFSSSGGGQPRHASAAGHAVAYKRVIDVNDVLSLSVPRGWAVDGHQDVQAGVYGRLVFPDLPPTTAEGVGMTASSLRAPNNEWKVDRAFIGVSAAAASRLRLPSLSSDAADGQLRAVLHSGDWTEEGCELAGESTLQRRGYRGFYRRWQNCGQVGTFFWEGYATPESRRFVVVLQLQTQRYRNLPVLDHVMRTFEVAAERVPR